jgi:hypothetical protein
MKRWKISYIDNQSRNNYLVIIENWKAVLSFRRMDGDMNEIEDFWTAWIEEMLEEIGW